MSAMKEGLQNNSTAHSVLRIFSVKFSVYI